MYALWRKRERYFNRYFVITHWSLVNLDEY